MAFVRRHHKLPPCPTVVVSARSKMDLLLAKAEPSASGSTSVITYLIKGKNIHSATAAGREK